ncbi:hypothetical protein R69919_05250 [Paraburkholderia gardini]|nr:hypothetical protein R69919_05250 [Paraburkholderia gardini]
MLIRCGECAARVSDHASNCPKCGYPLGGRQRTQTIEKTGKPYKAVTVVCWVVILVLTPILFISGHPGLGVAAFILGGVTEMFVKIGAWWDHG